MLYTIITFISFVSNKNTVDNHVDNYCISMFITCALSTNRMITHRNGGYPQRYKYILNKFSTVFSHKKI